MNRPPSTEFRVEPADYQTDFQDLRRVRESVFVVEQNVPIELEWDALDPLCRHVLARDNTNRAIGTGRLTPEGKIGRMAVLPEWRGKGVGESLLQALVDQTRTLGWKEVILNAQASAIDFYTRYGFEPVGARFQEAGIEHQTMRRAIEPLETGSEPLHPSLRPRFDTVETLEQAIVTSAWLIANGRREICLLSRDLDYPICANISVLDAVRSYATAGVGGVLRVLLFDPIAPQQQANPWLELAQRLPSAFAFRTIEEPTDRQYPSAFLITDRGGVYFRSIGSRIEGEACDGAPARARQLRELFNRMWEGARPCTEYRALGI